MTAQKMTSKVEFYNQEKYNLWIASKPDFSAVTDFRAYNLPGLTALPDLPAVTDFRADRNITALRK